MQQNNTRWPLNVPFPYLRYSSSILFVNTEFTLLKDIRAPSTGNLKVTIYPLCGIRTNWPWAETEDAMLAVYLKMW